MGVFKIDLKGKKFGRLKVLSFVGTTKHRKSIWLCRCACGNCVERVQNNLMVGKTKSCGCLRSEVTAERKTIHGYSGTKEYQAWGDLKKRCKFNKKYYVDRNIGVCRRWQKFSNFLLDMGKAPSKAHSIDRVDNTKGYYKSNCRWATHTEQMNNRSFNKYITWKGKRQSLADWARELNIPYLRLLSRFRYGWSVERAFTAKPYERRSAS